VIILTAIFCFYFHEQTMQTLVKQTSATSASRLNVGICRLAGAADANALQASFSHACQICQLDSFTLATWPSKAESTYLVRRVWSFCQLLTQLISHFSNVLLAELTIIGITRQHQAPVKTQHWFMTPPRVQKNLGFYPHDAMLARSLRQRRVCPSVCPDVTRRYCA